ncbi:hypothetical protein ACOSQ2_007692 [Xanthoceras sorbifolium]
MIVTDESHLAQTQTRPAQIESCMENTAIADKKLLYYVFKLCCNLKFAKLFLTMLPLQQKIVYNIDFAAFVSYVQYRPVN